MKSIIEEASSVFKAIEKGLSKAGNPKEFSVKILEEAEKNFLGFTKKPARVAIFFSDKPQQYKKTEFQQKQKSAKVITNSIVNSNKEKSKPAYKALPAQAAKQEETKNFWSPEMVEAAKNWFEKLLRLTNKSSVNFSLNPERYYLKISVADSICQNTAKERQLFAALSMVLMQSLRKEFNLPFKGHKIILMRDGQAAS